MPIHDSDYFTVTTSGYNHWPTITTTDVHIDHWPDETTTVVTDGFCKTFTAKTYPKNDVNKKEKKEMANAKMCDICGAVYSAKKYEKIFDDMEENYDIHLRFFDSCSDDVEICPDCYKALIDKLVERGLELVEKDDDKKNDD